MLVQPRQLPRTLQSGVPAVTLLSSADEFLLQEAADLVRTAARDQGFSERQKLSVERAGDWQALIAQAQSLSLFDDKKLIEIHLPSAKPGDAGAKAILEYIELAPEENRLLLITGKLEATSLRSKWFKSVEKSALVCRLWPISARELPSWIAERVRRHGLRLDADAIKLLAERTEGNLLAAAQEIEKLALLAPDKSLSADDLLRSIGNSARYNAFELVESCMHGHADKALQMLHGLQSEGVDARSILWALSYEIRNVSTALGNGGPSEAQRYFQNQRLPKNRQAALQRYLQRCSSSGIRQLHRLSAEADRRIKGASKASPWEALAELVVELSGRPVSVIQAS